jgi:hypothetical protein
VASQLNVQPTLESNSMKKSLLIILLFSTACASSTKLKDNSTKDYNAWELKSSALVFKSSANGVADILLTLKPDNTFTFYMKIIPQPTTNDKESVINTSGKWTKQGNRTRLTFKKSKLILNALFDQSYAANNQFKIINERTVDVNDKLDEITIWGVACTKIKK